MKKSEIYLKALRAIPFGIFCYEMVNVIVSLEYGEYIRIETLGNGFNLTSTVVSYLCCMVVTYLGKIILTNEFNLEIPIKEECKRAKKHVVEIMLILWIIVIAFGIAGYFNRYELIIGILIGMEASGLIALEDCVKLSLEKHTIKEINKKLKESIKNVKH